MKSLCVFVLVMLSIIGIINTFRLDTAQERLTDIKIEYFILNTKYSDVKRELEDIKNPPIKVQCDSSELVGMTESAEYLFSQL